MKVIQTFLFAVFCCSVILLAFQTADRSGASIKPDGTGSNPMKANVEQFNRIQPDAYATAG